MADFFIQRTAVWLNLARDKSCDSMHPPSPAVFPLTGREAECALLIDNAPKAEKERIAKCPVIARPVLKLVVAIRFLCVKRTDSHTSDVGHWLGMTGSSILQHAHGSSPRSRILLLMHFGDTLLSLSRDSFSGTFPMCKSAISLQIA